MKYLLIAICTLSIGITACTTSSGGSSADPLTTEERSGLSEVSGLKVSQ